MDVKEIVGREAELEALQQALDHAHSGTTTLRLIGGEPGIGKTALALALEQRASRLGVSTTWGRCWEAGEAPAFWPWNRVLRECARQLGRDRLEQILAQACAIADLPDALRSGIFLDLPDKPPESRIATAHEGTRLRIFDAVTEALANLCEQQPTLLILDDLHAADESSLLLLLYVMRELRHAKLMIVAAYRNTEVDQRPELTPLLAKVAREGSDLILGGLNINQASKLYLQITGNDLGPGSVADLCYATGGNPLFFTELARLRANGTAAATSVTPLPLVLSEILDQRLQKLPAATRHALDTAALIGREFSTRLLAVALKTSPTEVLTTLAPASKSQIIEPLAAAEGSGIEADYHFSHDFLREFIATSITTEARLESHKRIADAMDHYRSTGSFADSTIARHLSNAVPLVSPKFAAQRLNKAAHAALRSCSYEEVIKLSGLALQTLLEHHEQDHHEASLAHLVSAHSELALGNFSEAKQTFKLAFSEAEAANSGSLAIRAALGYGALHEVGRTGPGLTKLLERGLELLGDQQPELRSLALGRLAQVLQYSSRRSESAEHAVEARKLVGSLNVPIIEAQVLLFTNPVLQKPSNVKQRIADAKRAVALAREVGNSRIEMVAHEELTRHALEDGDVNLADESRAIVGQIAAELKNRIPTWLWMTHEVTRVCMDGHLDQAEKQAQEALEYGKEHSNHNVWLTYFSFLHDLLWHQYDIAKAIPTMMEICRQAPATSPTQTGLIWAKAHLQKDDPAVLATLDQYVENGFSTVYYDPFWLASMQLLSETAFLTSHHEAAKQLYEILTPYPNSHVTLYQSCYRGSIRRVLGLLAHCLGDYETADKHFAAAIRAEQRMRAVVFECHARVERVNAIQAAGRAADKRQLIQSELKTVKAYLATFKLPRVEALLLKTEKLISDELIVTSPATTKDSTQWRVKLQRKGDYWTLTNGHAAKHIKHSRGFEYLYQLLSAPNQSYAALDLVQTLSTSAATAVYDTGAVAAECAIPLADEAALKQYRDRINDLRALIAEAELHNDIGASENYRQEMAEIVAHVRATTGIGNAPRSAPNNSERARSAVTKALRTAIKKIQSSEPELGRYLQDCIKTGQYCEYNPSPIRPVQWQLLVTGSDNR